MSEIETEPLFPVEWPHKAPPGTNARLLAVKGTDINPNLSDLYAPERASIFITEEENPGECKGGVCVELFFRKFLSKGQSMVLIAHVNGNDEIRPDGYVVHPEIGRTDFGPAFQALDDRLVRLRLLPPKDQNKTQE